MGMSSQPSPSSLFIILLEYKAQLKTNHLHTNELLRWIKIINCHTRLASSQLDSSSFVHKMRGERNQINFQQTFSFFKKEETFRVCVMMGLPSTSGKDHCNSSITDGGVTPFSPFGHNKLPRHQFQRKKRNSSGPHFYSVSDTFLHPPSSIASFFFNI